MDEPADHYATLGLDRKCPAGQVRSAYRLLAKKLHPDVNPSPDAAARLREINAAYEVLGDLIRRAAYDRELGREERRGLAAAPGRVERNIAHDVFLRVEEFLRGTTLELRVADPANAGAPEIHTLVVPAGTAPGARFRLPRDGPFEGGFVIARAKLLPGGRFRARGSDLRMDLRIGAQRAAAGGAELVPGAGGGMVRVQIPARTARGAVIRVIGEGLPKARGGRGDLLVRIVYRPEVRVSRRQGFADRKPPPRIQGFRKP